MPSCCRAPLLRGSGVVVRERIAEISVALGIVICTRGLVVVKHMWGLGCLPIFGQLGLPDTEKTFEDGRAIKCK